MSTPLLVIDLSSPAQFPKGLACVRYAAVDTARVLGVVSHISGVLKYVESSHQDPTAIYVLSDQAAPSNSNSISYWGYGWRSGRDVQGDWAEVLVSEGRAEVVVWVECPSGKVTTIGGASVEIATRSLVDVLRTCNFLLVHKTARPIPIRHRDVGPPDYPSTVTVWHGSAVQGLRTLAPMNGKLWLSFSKPFAACFSATPYSNKGFFQGVDRASSPSRPEVYLVVPPGHRQSLERPCSLYAAQVGIDELRFKGVHGYEQTCARELGVVEEIEYSSCRSALASLGVEVVELDRSEPLDPALAQRCQPFRHSIEAFLDMPLGVAARLRCKQWALQFWLRARGELECSEEDVPCTVQALHRYLMPTIASNNRLPEEGYHSLHHLFETALFAAWISAKENANPIIAGLIGLLHDVGRTGDEEGEDHAVEGVSFMDRVLGRELSYVFSPEDLAVVRFGIAEHARGQKSSIPAVAAAWDADRLRLRWERGVDAKYFSTKWGLRIAGSPSELPLLTLLDAMTDRQRGRDSAAIVPAALERSLT